MASPLTPETCLCSTGHICQCSTKTLKMQCSAVEDEEKKILLRFTVFLYHKQICFVLHFCYLFHKIAA